MARLYSSSFIQYQGLDTSIPLLTEPGEIWVLRELDLYYNPSTFVPCDFRVTGDAGQTMLFTQFTIADGTRTYQWQGRLVIASGIIVESNQPIDVSLSGYRLTTP